MYWINIYVMVWAWAHHFPLHDKGVVRASALGILLKATTSAQVTRCLCRLSCQKWTWHHQKHHMMMYQWWHGTFGWWHLYHIYVRVGGYKQVKTCMGRKRFPSSKISSVELIGPNKSPLVCFGGSLHQDQPGILYLTTTNMCLASLINLNQHLSVIWTLFILNSVAWVAIKPMEPS